MKIIILRTLLFLVIAIGFYAIEASFHLDENQIYDKSYLKKDVFLAFVAAFVIVVVPLLFFKKRKA